MTTITRSDDSTMAWLKTQINDYMSQLPTEAVPDPQKVTDYINQRLEPYHATYQRPNRIDFHSPTHHTHWLLEHGITD